MRNKRLCPYVLYIRPINKFENLPRTSLFFLSLVLDSVTKTVKPEAKISIRKSLNNPQRINSGSHHSLNYKTEFLTPPHLCKTRHLTPQGGFTARFCYSSPVLFFPFLFIFAESLKDHNKSQKNYKIENLILLDSTSVDLYNEHIIQYILVPIFLLQFQIYTFLYGIIYKCSFYGPIVVKFLWWANYSMLLLW